jgi:HrpA-like RNA helicase
MERQRKSLPAWKARDDFLSKLDESCKSGNRVVLVTGDTGCGKTTQIPQFILEENPTSAKIVIAQPRRLAVSFAVIMVISCRAISILMLEYSTHA